MTATFISEPLEPDASFDLAAMATGTPGLPRSFRWRGGELTIAEVLESWKEHGNCRNGSGERYLRKHAWRVRLADGRGARIYFQRSAHGAIKRTAPRWWLHSLENVADAD